KRDPEKWEPVFGKDHAQIKTPRGDADSTNSHPALHPGPGTLCLALEALDLALLAHGQPDIVEAMQQRVLAMRLDLKSDHAAVGTADLLLFQIDAQRGIGAALGVVEQLLQVFRRNLDRQHAIL